MLKHEESNGDDDDEDAEQRPDEVNDNSGSSARRDANWCKNQNFALPILLPLAPDVSRRPPWNTNRKKVSSFPQPQSYIYIFI